MSNTRTENRDHLGNLVTRRFLVDLLKQGVDGWNTWREANPGINLLDVPYLFSSANFGGVNLDGVNLSRVNLKWILLRGASLRGANLENARMEFSELTDTNLEGAILRGVNFHGVLLGRTNIQGTDFRGATILAFLGRTIGVPAAADPGVIDAILNAQELYRKRA